MFICLGFCSPVFVRQPESEAEVVAGSEGSSVAGVKRGLSLETAAAGQDVKRFRTVTGAPTVSSVYSPPVCPQTLYL